MESLICARCVQELSMYLFIYSSDQPHWVETPVVSTVRVRTQRPRAVMYLVKCAWCQVACTGRAQPVSRYAVFNKRPNRPYSGAALGGLSARLPPLLDIYLY